MRTTSTDKLKQHIERLEREIKLREGQWAWHG